MSYAEQADKIAGQIALLKLYITKCGREIAEDATLVFGGRGITVSGMGKFIENVSLKRLRLSTRSIKSHLSPSVPPNISLRCHSWWSRGCSSRPRRTTSRQKNAQRLSPIIIMYLLCNLVAFIALSIMSRLVHMYLVQINGS